MNKFPRTFAFAALAATLFAAPAHTEDVKAGDLVITQAWSRATPSGAKIAGGYLTIENKGTAADRLVGGSGNIAGKVEVHEMAVNNGVMTMRPLDKGLAIEPGKTVKLAPGGYHLMMFDLKGPFKQGEKVPVTRLQTVDLWNDHVLLILLSLLPAHAQRRQRPVQHRHVVLQPGQVGRGARCVPARDQRVSAGG